MNKQDRMEIFRAINNVSKRQNEMLQKLDEVMQTLNKLTNEKITINSGGIDGLADVVASHDGAIEDLATLISGLEVK